MDVEEKLDALIQNCFVELEDRTAEFTCQVLLNYNLYDDEEGKDKLRFIQEKIKRIKKKLGTVKGDLAESIFGIYSPKIVFSDYHHFYDMAHKRLEEPLKEYITWTIYFEHEGDNNFNKEKYVEGKLAIEHNALKKWIKAVTLCLNLHLIERHEKLFQDNIQPTINDEFYSKRKTSELIKFRDGRRLNLKERYHLIDKITDVDRILNSKNVSREKKEEILAYILHCNPKNAQQILNGTYDAKFRESEINTFVEDL